MVAESNALSCLSGTNNALVSLVYASMNAGPTSPRITCNETSDAYRGFEFSGPNGGTYWRGNKMEGHLRAMELNKAGVIGTQGSISAPIDNEWNGSWPTGTYGTWTGDAQTFASASPLWIQNVSPFIPQNNDGSPNFNSYQQQGGLNFVTSGSYTCGAGPNQIVVPVPLEENYENDDQYFIARYNLYRQLRIDQGLIDSDPTLQDWYNESHEIITILTNIEEYLATGDLEEAQSQVEGLDSEEIGQVANNYRLFYNLYIKFIEQEEFTGEDSTSLLTLINMCPGEQGACVYQARMLYQAMSNLPVYVVDDCITDPVSRKRSQSEENKHLVKKLWDIMMFPNPAQHSVNLISSAKDERLKISVSDLSGRKIKSLEVQLAGHTGAISLDLDNGIYFIVFTNLHGENATKKLIISK